MKKRQQVPYRPCVAREIDTLRASAMSRETLSQPLVAAESNDADRMTVADKTGAQRAVILHRPCANRQDAAGGGNEPRALAPAGGEVPGQPGGRVLQFALRELHLRRLRGPGQDRSLDDGHRV